MKIATLSTISSSTLTTKTTFHEKEVSVFMFQLIILLDVDQTPQ